MQKTFDAQGQKLNSGIFAEAYRATIPVLADAKHVTIRMSNARRSELFDCGDDVSDVVEVGSVEGKTRAVAVPVTVHVKDGAEVIADDSVVPSTVSFEINGLAEVQIVNLKLNATEQAALDKAAAAQKALEEKNAQSALDAKIQAAKQQGREEALLEQAKQEGRAEVGKPDGSSKIQ